MRRLWSLALVAGCGGGGAAPDAGVNTSPPDAPDTAPTLTSFVPTPGEVQPGVPTEITWMWTYLVEPPIPMPTCTIDHGVGEVTRGQTTTVTLNETTTFRLTCANRAGMTARDTVIRIPPAAPNIATFTATPTSVMPNAATTVTFEWTFTGSPSPAPTCTIEGIGAATSGMTASLTLPQARTFRLRCTNLLGSAVRDVTVAVDECSSGAHDCGANATCNETIEGFTCSCNAGYTGNGDVCGVNASCSTNPGLCGANARCAAAGTHCECLEGYVGDGVTCARVPLTFVTNSTGTGNLSTWTLAGGNTGLAAADAVCASEAASAGLPGTYVAWMSDATSDAYCRVHGLTGKKANNCGQGALPVAAGPWLRTDAARTPAAPTIDKLLAPTRQTFYPVTYRANGTDTAGSSPQLIFTGTGDTGELSGTACSNWTTSSGTAAMGDMFGGGTAWTDQGNDPSCATTGRLRCVEVGTGPALPSRHPANAKRIFVTSVSGNGVLGTWPDAQGATNIAAADAICQARARYAGYANAASFKAWASYSSTGASSRFVSSTGPFYRPDGIAVAASESVLTGSNGGRIGAPIYQTELNTYVAGTADTGNVWTGTLYHGSYYTTATSCSSWASSTSSAVVGRTDLADYRWVQVGTGLGSPTLQSCSATDYRLYCIEDRP